MLEPYALDLKVVWLGRGSFYANNNRVFHILAKFLQVFKGTCNNLLTNKVMFLLEVYLQRFMYQMVISVLYLYTTYCIII